MPKVLEQEPETKQAQKQRIECVYSTYPFYVLVLQAEERAQREDDRGRIVYIKSKEQKNLQFNHHKAHCDAATVELLKTKLWYGTDFITATDLKKMLDDKNSTVTARGFIREMHRRSVLSGAGKQAVDEMKILQELVELRT